MTNEKRDNASKEYCKKVGDDCLCQRTSPGTKVGEHIYCFCGCDIEAAFMAGYDFGATENDELGAEFTYVNALKCELNQWREQCLHLQEELDKIKGAK